MKSESFFHALDAEPIRLLGGVSEQEMRTISDEIAASSLVAPDPRQPDFEDAWKRLVKAASARAERSLDCLEEALALRALGGLQQHAKELEVNTRNTVMFQVMVLENYVRNLTVSLHEYRASYHRLYQLLMNDARNHGKLRVGGHNGGLAARRRKDGGEGEYVETLREFYRANPKASWAAGCRHLEETFMDAPSAPSILKYLKRHGITRESL